MTFKAFCGVLFVYALVSNDTLSFKYVKQKGKFVILASLTFLLTRSK